MELTSKFLSITFMLVCRWVHMWVWAACMEIRGQFWVSCLRAFYLLRKTRSLIGWKCPHINQGRLAGHYQLPGTCCLCFSSLYLWNDRLVPPHPIFLCGFWDPNPVPPIYKASLSLMSLSHQPPMQWISNHWSPGVSQGGLGLAIGSKGEEQIGISISRQPREALLSSLFYVGSMLNPSFNTMAPLLEGKEGKEEQTEKEVGQTHCHVSFISQRHQPKPLLRSQLLSGTFIVTICTLNAFDGWNTVALGF